MNIYEIEYCDSDYARKTEIQADNVPAACTVFDAQLTAWAQQQGIEKPVLEILSVRFLQRCGK